MAKTDSFYSCLCVWIPDFQLHPTFSEQPPTNGVKTRLVKMCRSQYNCSISVFCGLRPRSQRLRGTKKVVNGRYPFNTSGAISQLSRNIKDTSLLWELRVFSLSVSQLRSKMVQSRKSCTNTLQKKQSVGETLSLFISSQDYGEEDIYVFFVSILLEPISPLCLASPAASALFLLVLASVALPIPPLSSATDTKRHKDSYLEFLLQIISTDSTVLSFPFILVPWIAFFHFTTNAALLNQAGMAIMPGLSLSSQLYWAFIPYKSEMKYNMFLNVNN